MKIGIDAFGLDHAQSGIGAYLYNLAHNLPEIQDVEYELFGAENDRYIFGTEKDIPFYQISISHGEKSERFWHRFFSQKFIASRKYDVVVYVAAAKMLPPVFRGKAVAVINCLLSRNLLDKKQRSHTKKIISRLKKVDRIIVASNFIKSDLLSLGLDSAKISVVKTGIDHSAFYQHPSENQDYVDVKPFAIKKPYIIYPSRISDADKKHIQLIRAFNAFKKKTGLSHRLVIAGSQGEYAEEVQKEAFSSPYASDIFLTGFFPRESFSVLYAGSDACVFPSVKEGIGMPVVEAMASGIPVAISDSGALVEIAGGNALSFNPDDEESFSSAIEKIVCDTELRSKQIASGLEWSGKFNWEETGKQFVDILKSIK